MKTILSALFAVLLLTPVFANAGPLPGYQPLFTLERTTNANQVVYEANLSVSGSPVHAYWNMLAQDGHTEELTRMEQNRAYGVEVLEQSPTEVKFVIKSFRAHPITIRLSPQTQKPYAVMTLDSGEKILVDFFLNLTRGLIPGVSSVDVSYRDQVDGPVLRETFDPNR